MKTQAHPLPGRIGFVLIATLALVVACESASPTNGPAVTEWGPLAVVPGSEAGDGALVRGSLQIDDRCVLLDEQGEDVLLVWPADRTAWNAEGGTVTFIRNNGQVARLRGGDQVSLGGGGSSRGEDGLAADEFMAGIDWVAEPDPECVVDSRWFIYELVD